MRNYRDLTKRINGLDASGVSDTFFAFASRRTFAFVRNLRSEEMRQSLANKQPADTSL